MDAVEFLFNGQAMRLRGFKSTDTLLDWMREQRGAVGTKEGCNEGDCGACTVMVSSLSESGATHEAQNACILFLPQLQGKAVRTVEGLRDENGALHAVQQAMITHHASQCGFCTPGFVMSLVAANESGNSDFDEALAGNLCRCTGYAPIIRAAEAARGKTAPPWSASDIAALKSLRRESTQNVKGGVIHRSLDAFAKWYVENPDATLVGGATDIGLWVTKQLKDLPQTAFLTFIPELRDVTVGDTEIRVGAAVSLTVFKALMQNHHPDFAIMLKRYGSLQVRNAATIGGNIANGSPIGDGPPALIALGARLHLRKGKKTREIALEDFFVSYGKQDIQAGEFVEAITIPRQRDTLKCYKISKRFDQDISALLGCFNIVVEAGLVSAARIAFGGMAATPKRATAVEAALLGKPWTQDTISAALTKFGDDFSPLSDMRASSDYRLAVAQNLLLRCFTEHQMPKALTRVHGVSA